MPDQFQKLDPIERLPMIDYDPKRIISLAIQEKYLIDAARSWWFDRKLTFLHQWDDFVNYEHPSVIESQPWIHIPMTYEKMMTWHSRIYKTIFSMDPVFHLEPLNIVNIDQMNATKAILQWYLRDEICNHQGLKPVIDELLWDIGTDGWGVLYKRWATIQRKYIDIEQVEQEAQEVQTDIQQTGKPRQPLAKYKEISKIITQFDGVMLETIPHENCYFPEFIPTSGDMNFPRMVMIERVLTEEDIELAGNRGLFDKQAAADVIRAGRGYDDGRKRELRIIRERLQGIDSQVQQYKNEYQIYNVFLREDLDDDGIPEEYVFTMSLRAKKILAATYLDRIARDHNRPLYKFDLMKRPRSSYSRGWVETLYSLQQEVDEFHNVRRVSGLIANVPWGFYRAASGMDKETLEVAPGKFYPIDDPGNDVKAMNFGNVTTWAMQEEQLAGSYADRLTSMPPMLQGQVPDNVGPLRSTSGVTSLIQESQAPMDVFIDRFRGPFGSLLQGIHADLQVRLPKIIAIKVLGENGQMMFGQDGNPDFMQYDRDDIAGKYKWTLAANSAQYNPQQDQQNAMQLAQTFLTQFPVQMGIVTPQNAYNLYRNIASKMNAIDIDKYLTKPQMVLTPMDLFQEYTSIINGRVPMIVMNDDHQAKIQGLTALMNTPEYQQGKSMNPPTVSPIADIIMSDVIKTHAAYLQMLQKMPAMGSQTGQQTSSVGGQAGGMMQPAGEAPQGGQNGGAQGSPNNIKPNGGMAARTNAGAGVKGSGPSGPPPNPAG